MLCFIFIFLFSCPFIDGQKWNDADNLIEQCYNEAIDEVTPLHNLQMNPNEIDISIRNYSIAALTAIKLSKITRNYDHSFHNDRLPRSMCPLKKYRCSYGKYRRSDGRCTNIWKPLAGSSMSPFSRRIHPNYDDDISSPRFHDHHGNFLPSPFVIEQSVYRKKPPSHVPLTQLFVDFADFIYKDLARYVSIQDSISCCNSRNPECYPTGGEHPLDCFVRSAPTPLPKCSFGRREQMNLETAFIDAGPVYHQFKEKTKSKLISHFSLDEKNPLINLFVAEHNWVVDQLAQKFPNFSHEKLFEESRKFVIAELQHITFHEFLPLLIGLETMSKYELNSETCDEELCSIIDANTLNEYGTVVGKFYKFMSIAKRHDSAGSIVRLSIQKAENSVVSKSELNEILMRSRDHGLGTYAQWREECGGGELESYEQLIDLVDGEVLNRIRKIFPDVRDVDLALLGLAENPVYGSLIGPTFGCITALQFQKAKFSDSYWYENHLSTDQLNVIQKTSLSSMLCRLGKTAEAPKYAFSIFDGLGNMPVSCNSTAFPKIDFSKWIVKESDAIETKFDDVVGDCIEEVNDIRRKRNSDNIQSDGFNSNAIHSYGRMMLAKDEAVSEANISFILLQTTKKLVLEKHLDLSQIQNVNIGTNFGVKPDLLCNPKPLPCDPTSPYRTHTGWCNNLEHPEWANTFRELKRLLPPHYDDGIDKPRLNAINGKNLPSPRLISNTVHFAQKIENIKYAHLLMEFGQFIDHDITHSPVDQNPDGTALNCSRCDSAQTVSSSCYPIPVPDFDKFFTQNQCLSFVRSLPAQKTLGYRNQMNQITAYLDGSVMYGSTNCEADRLRTFQDGKMKVTQLPMQPRGHYGITLSQAGESEQDGCVSFPQAPCFIAGDDRNSQQTLLIAVHSVFHREHDRVSTSLKEINPHWNDEQLYQETRKIISAQFAHIVYSQYLPIILGQKLIDQYDLRPLSSGYYNGYDHCDASIIQPFSTAAFRFGHSTVTRFTPMQESIRQPAMSVVDLASEFLNMTKIYGPHSVESLIGGLHGKYQMQTDRYVDDAVRNFLFSDRGKVGTGLDLVAINIQRGRDHGIQPYNQYRSLCGLERLTSFHSIFSDISQDGLKALSDVYESPEDIDLFTGIVSEKLIPGGIVGPTAACIIGEQFRRLKRCDRFYYENGNDHTKFSQEQLDEIRKVSLSSLICANTKVPEIAQDAFSVPDPFLNSLISCKLYKQLDFTKWRDTEHCIYKSKQIALHSSLLVSPCNSCTCTTTGVMCITIRPDCQSISHADMQNDSLCIMQCAQFVKKSR